MTPSIVFALISCNLIFFSSNKLTSSIFAFCKLAEILFSNFEISFSKIFSSFCFNFFFLNYLLSSLLSFPVVSFLTITDHLLSMYFHYLYYHHCYYYYYFYCYYLNLPVLLIIIHSVCICNIYYYFFHKLNIFSVFYKRVIGLPIAFSSSILI